MRSARLSLGTLVAAVAVAAVAYGCGADEEPIVSGPTDLRITAQWPAGLQEFRLTCNPTGGDIPDARRVCATLGSHPVMVFPPQASATCAGSVGIPPAFDITGTFRGEAVNVTSLRSCDAPVRRSRAAELWERLFGDIGAAPS
jgi:hypothetical protein